MLLHCQIKFGINGLVGGLTAGIGPAASEASRFSKLILNNLDKILLVSGSSLTSFFNFESGKFSTNDFKEASKEFIMDIFMMSLSVKTGNFIEKSNSICIDQLFMESTVKTIAEEIINGTYCNVISKGLNSTLLDDSNKEYIPSGSNPYVWNPTINTPFNNNQYYLLTNMLSLVYESE